MIRISRQALLFLIVVLTCFPSWAAEYSRNLDFPPVRLTLETAAELANDLFTYVQSVNATEEQTKGEVEFKSLKYNATFDLPLTPEDLKKSPDRVSSFTVRLRSRNSKINYVVLSLQDVTRSLTVSGNSNEHITGLISIVNDKLEQHHVLFAGPKSRMFLAAVFYLVVLSGYGFITWRFPGPKVFPVAILMLAVLPNAIIWLFPWDRIFPGTLVTRDGIGLLDKHAPLFTFLSFLVTIAAILWQVVVSRHKRLQQTS